MKYYIILIVVIGIAGAALMLWAFFHFIGISLTPYTKTEQKCNEYVEFACRNQLDEPKVENAPSGGTVKAVWQGTPVHRGHIPHMVFIHTNQTKTICGGSLISENFVLTAAHCGKKISIEGAKIVLGAGILGVEDDITQTSYSNEVYFYPGPSGRIPDDISLVKLNTKAGFTAYVRPVCLNVRIDVELKDLTAAGWGKHEEDNYSKQLKTVDLEPMPESDCKKDYPDVFNATSFICAGHSNTYNDVCEGDSGGPLQMPHKSSPCKHVYQLVGVVSRGAPCEPTKRSRTYGTFAKVAFYIPWIEKTVWP